MMCEFNLIQNEATEDDYLAYEESQYAKNHRIRNSYRKAKYDNDKNYGSYLNYRYGLDCKDF